MTALSTSGTPERRLWLLVLVLFVSYLCVAIPLLTVPVFVVKQLGYNNACAGLAVGVAFFSTILARGRAGHICDRKGVKIAALQGLGFYTIAGLIALAAALLAHMTLVSLVILLLGRLLLGMGESLMGVSITSWGIALIGVERSGKAMALVGAAMYSALAVGGPVGLFLLQKTGFVGAMAVSTVLPALGLLVVLSVPASAPSSQMNRPSFVSIVGRIWRHGMTICLQGIGFAAIGAFFTLYFLHRHWADAGLGFTAFGGGFVLVRVFFGHFPDRFGGLPVAIASLAVETIGQLFIWTSATPFPAFLGAFLTGLGCSMIFPAMGREVVRLIEPHLRGTALGGFLAFQDLAYGLTGPLAGLLVDYAGYGSVFLLGACAAAIGFLIAVWLQRTEIAAARS